MNLYDYFFINFRFKKPFLCGAIIIDLEYDTFPQV